MMQNNNEFDDVLRIVNENYRKQHITYLINKEESKKFRQAKIKEYKKIRDRVISISVGTLIIFSLRLLDNINLKLNEQLHETTQVEATQPLNVSDINQYINNNVDTINAVVEQEMEEQENVETIEQTLIKKYCEIYGLDYEKVYVIASTLTDDFTNEEYLSSNNPGYKINQKITDNKECGIITFVRHLYQKPQDFGCSLSEIKSKESITINKGNEEYKVKYYSDIFGVDPVLILAIEYQESTKNGIHYNSQAYLEGNNPAGLMDPKNTSHIWKFQNPDMGIIEHVYQLKTYFIDKGLTTPTQIKEKYAPSNAKNDENYNLNRFWVSGVESFMKEIRSNPDIFNEREENIENNMTM